VAPTAAGVEAFVDPPGDIDLVAAHELVAVAPRDLHIVAGAERLLLDLGHAHVVAVRVEAADRVVEEFALEAVVPAVGDLGLEGGVEVDRGGVALRDEVALAVAGEDADGGRDFEIEAGVGFQELDVLVHDRSGDVAGRVREADEVAIAKAHMVIARGW